MTISRTVGYAICAMTQLAAVNGSHPISCRLICQRAAIPERFVRQILRNLTHVGLVTSLRGLHGGYSLAKPSTTITLLAIFETFEAPFKSPASSPLDVHSAINDALVDITASMRRRLASVTLDELQTLYK